MDLVYVDPSKLSELNADQALDPQSMLDIAQQTAEEQGRDVDTVFNELNFETNH